MTITTHMNVDEPIIYVTIEGQIDEAQVGYMHQEVFAYAQKLGIGFLIFDLRSASGTVQECLTLLLSQALKNLEEKFRLIVIRELEPDEWREKIDYPVFQDLDTALVYVRRQVAGLGSET